MAGASWDWLVLFLWILVLSCAVRQTASYHETLLESGTEPPATDMISVNWTLYSGLFLTWNEASHYCHQQGGHLPVLDTPLTTQAFSMAADRWHHGDLIDTDVWLGLHSSLSGTVPEIWEGICLLQQSDVIYWDSDYDVTEPDGLDTERCVRMKTDAATWGTTDCGNAMGVVCEWRGGGLSTLSSDDYINSFDAGDYQAHL
ncbi:hypothetical protein BaRGS_00029196 [Batillaria attramentaria]|uniref:C-type lectin domain-containing protein n=1 Tax=Batillaria attramentaria TaxID=370345 RepID=A0ABD0JXS4_9CAEN